MGLKDCAHCNLGSELRCLFNQEWSAKPITVAFDNRYEMLGIAKACGMGVHMAKPGLAVDCQAQSHVTSRYLNGLDDLFKPDLLSQQSPFRLSRWSNCSVSPTPSTKHQPA